MSKEIKPVLQSEIPECPRKRYPTLPPFFQDLNDKQENKSFNKSMDRDNIARNLGLDSGPCLSFIHLLLYDVFLTILARAVQEFWRRSRSTSSPYALMLQKKLER
ncbi:PREDICTED: uncharacterized protein LOC104810353 isoform X2 [Tarenaya hassleriana]|uniref:uncharacterized protein LOC104810353 isoform X2 n=1 Tax=Tarenaya hassleriana TaxID=28532 RepID=UPI00053C1D7B|nr:PREDICTED: uncharacterized protein LOC104810353 isoform X2 [Tarenaya hassleriana]